MNRRRISAALGCAAVALALPAIARAVVITVTEPADATATASCPGTTASPCTVVSRTTAVQVQVGAVARPFTVTRLSDLVGWEITLSAPTSAQIHYFDEHEGGTAEAALAVLRQVRGLDYRLDYVSPLVSLQPYFGRTATFALPSSVPVHPGDVLALSVPTWAPALDLAAGQRAAWRASRPRAQCSDVAVQTAQTSLHGVADYYCIYRTALISYGAIEISTP